MENNILEQPISNFEDSHAVNTEYNLGQSEENFDMGSTKFKRVEDLNNAYNNLQAEFTKKCQLLKELERSMENRDIPRYKLDSWQGELSDFFEKYPGAKEHSEEIAKVLLENDDLAKKSDCLLISWANILNDIYRKEEDLAQDTTFLDKYIYSNENIKDEIIKRYLGAMEKTPTLINGSKGVYNIAPKSKPKNMRDAYSIVSEIFR